MTCDNTIVRFNDKEIGRLDTVDEVEIINCLIIIANSHMHILTLLYFYKEHFESSTHNLILDTLEETSSFIEGILDKLFTNPYLISSF